MSCHYNGNLQRDVYKGEIDELLINLMMIRIIIIIIIITIIIAVIIIVVIFLLTKMC